MTWLLAFATLAVVGWIAYDIGYDRGWADHNDGTSEEA